MTLGQRIKQLRVDKELNQPELANAMGIEQSYLSKLENDKAFPSDEMFEKLLMALKMTVDDFIKGFDRNFIANQLTKLTAIKQHTSTLNKSAARYLMKWLLCSALMIAVGATVFAAGYKNWLTPSQKIFSYTSMGVVKEGESLLLFENSPDRMKNDVLKRVVPHSIELPYLDGEYFVKPVDFGLRYYDYSGSRFERNKAASHWMQIIGLFCFLLGVVGLMIEPKIRRLRSWA